MALTIESYHGDEWVDITAYCPIMGNSELGLPALEVEQNADNHIAVARFCIGGTGLDSIDSGSEIRIRIEADGIPEYQTVFGGVAAIVEDLYTIGLERYSLFECQDYNILLEQTLVLWYTIDDGDVDSTEIGTIFSTYRDDIGTDSFVETVDGDMEVMAITSTLREAMELICDRTGAQFYVDFDKELHYWSGQGFAAAGYQISDEPDMSTTFPCGNLRRITDTTQLIDKVYIIGDGVAAWVGDGEYEAIVWDNTIRDNAGITERGNAIISERSSAAVYYTCVVWEDGLAAGEYCNVTNAGLGLSAAEFNIRRIVLRPLSEDGAVREYELELGDNPWYEDWWSGDAIAMTMQGGAPMGIPSGQGYILRSNATTWESYAAGTLGAVLIGDGTDITSDTTPTLVGDLTLDDGDGNSPGVVLKGGHDGQATLRLIDDATAANSDLRIKLPGNDTNSLLEIVDSDTVQVAYVDADGNAALDGDLSIANGKWIGLGSSAGRIVFDDQTVDQIEILAADLLINGQTLDSAMETAGGARLVVFDDYVAIDASEDKAQYRAWTYSATSTHYPIWQGRRARGTRGSPSATQANDILARVGSAGYGTAFPSESSGYMQVKASQNWGAAAYGTQVDLYVTPDDDTTAVIALTLLNSGIGYFPYGMRTDYLTGTMGYIPTDAQFDTITSSTPAGVGDGFLAVVKDTATSMVVLLGSDGANWLYWRGAVAA